MRVRELINSEQDLFQFGDRQGYGSGEHLSDRASVSLEGDSDEYDEPENQVTNENPYGHQQELMYTFPGSAQPLSSSSVFNSCQSQLSSSETPSRSTT